MHSISASLSGSTDVNVSTLVKRDQNCKAIDNSTGEPCGETEGLRILDEFRKLYESRIEKIDGESGGDFDRVSTKLQIMSDWIKDLGDQNTMLVQTVQDLEQAACSRVKLLEEKLKQSSQIVEDNLTRSNCSEEALNILSNRVNQLQKDEKFLVKKIEYLQSDIRGLLELIRRACCQNVWSLEGITFFEIQPKDIPLPPLNCICNQEKVDTEQIRSLNLEIEQLQENEKKMIRSKMELEGKIEDFKTKLSVKDETIKRYASRLQSFCEKLKEYSKQTSQVINHPLTITSDQNYDIMLTPDILESVLITKDTENKSLYRHLQEVESKYMVYTHKSNIDTNNLQKQLEEESKKVQQLQAEVARLEEEVTETRNAMTKVVTLKNENCHANIGNSFKNEVIKEMCKELKKVTLEDTSPRKVRVDTSNYPQIYSPPSIDPTRYSKKDELLSFLNGTKVHIQKECEILSDLKLELKKFVEKLTDKTAEADNCIISDHANKNRFCTSDMSDKLGSCIEIITKMYSEREKEITLYDCMIKKEESQCHCGCGDSNNIKLNINSARQFKLMEEFRVCTVEAQAATEDIREEISAVVSIFNSRHQNYEDLSKMVVSVQSCSAKTREGLLEAINKLELQEEEGLRRSERIANSKIKLKDIKNQINLGQSELFRCINSIRENIQECNQSGYIEACISNDLLTVVTEEVEQILTNLQFFQTQGGCITSILKGLKSGLCAIDCSLRDLQKKTGEVILNNEVAKTTFCEKESRLAKLEEEVDCAHSKMQDVLETFLSTKQEEKEQFPHFNNQGINDIIKTKEDLHKLRKEYDDLKLNMSQQARQLKYDEKLNKWENRVTDLEDQIRVLQHEVKCKQEANNFLKNSIQSTEKELMDVRSKAENYRQCQSKDNMELKKKIIELENIIKTQKKVESNLQESLNSLNNESKIKKSTDISNVFCMDHGTEAIFLRCDYPSKHENISHWFKTLQDAVQSSKLVVQDLESELKRLICDESSKSSVSTRSVVTLIETLEKCRKRLNTCSDELSKLESAVYSKEKLLENLEKVIQIQQDSLKMSQAEVKDLHQKLQEKIDKQSFTIAQYEREKNELLKQNELQIQTIGHLQNAVVEAKRNLDQMGHKAMSDLCEKDETIRQLMMCVDETQEQYNECFTEATSQDLLLDLQRDAIDSLHKRIRSLEYDKYLNATILHTTYYSILNVIQEQIYGHIKDFQALRCKMEYFVQAKNNSKCQCENTKNMLNYTEQKRPLDQLDTCSCAICSKNESYDTANLEYISHNCASYMERHSSKEVDMENICQIQRLKAELQKIKDTECDLRCENQQLKTDLQYHISKTEDLIKKLEHIKQKETKYKELLSQLENGEREIENLNGQIINKEEIIRDQSHELEALRNKFLMKNQQVEEDLFELNTSEQEMLNTLCDRIYSLKRLLREKSDCMVKLQADYKLLENENSILKNQNSVIENQAKDNIIQLKEKLKEIHLRLHQTENNYQRVTEDFKKVQDKLLLATKREADLQESLMILEKDYCSKISNVENEAVSLRELVNNLSEELEKIKKELISKNITFFEIQDKCKNYADQLDVIRQEFAKEKEELVKVEDANCGLNQQLQAYMDENYYLGRQNISLKENNSTYMIELQSMRKSLLELEKECYLKDRSLMYMSADLTEAAVSRSELCKESQHIVSCIRDYMDQQKRCIEHLTKNLENKQRYIMQLENKVLLLKIKKLKRINLLTKRRRMHKQLSSRGYKRIPINGYISPSDVQSAGTHISVIPSSSYTDLYKKCFRTSIRTNRRTSTSDNSCWFSKIEDLTNKVRKSNQRWRSNFKNGTESDTSLEESRDYGYQSSTSK
ncbi:reticulocyte-binding protein 2-like isoform X2 [Odontomachus brunneus]|uniref:reticulocyte-binding protein 2-like isoform X2 n=1 Tax=Odontomachus brunneus TaxID=486640 RepID=UPI0013F18F1A|nr:reticulocyte-binding protein 2-like isoform X2 [Odontomachus brunneus]